MAVSERGVVFLRDQDVTPTEMKDLMLRITELSGCVCCCFFFFFFFFNTVWFFLFLLANP